MVIKHEISTDTTNFALEVHEWVRQPDRFIL